MARDKANKKKKTRGSKKVRKATKKQRRKKTSKSGQPKAQKEQSAPFHFLRTGAFLPTFDGSAAPLA
jgi:hypothetical protein